MESARGDSFDMDGSFPGLAIESRRSGLGQTSPQLIIRYVRYPPKADISRNIRLSRRCPCIERAAVGNYGDSALNSDSLRAFPFLLRAFA